MELVKAIEAATKNLIMSDEARTYTAETNADGQVQKYVLVLKRDKVGGLLVITWGFDYEGFSIPKTRSELIKAKTMLQLRKIDGPLDSVDQVALRYYKDILQRENR